MKEKEIHQHIAQKRISLYSVRIRAVHNKPRVSTANCFSSKYYTSKINPIFFISFHQ